MIELALISTLVGVLGSTIGVTNQILNLARANSLNSNLPGDSLKFVKFYRYQTTLVTESGQNVLLDYTKLVNSSLVNANQSTVDSVSRLKGHFLSIKAKLEYMNDFKGQNDICDYSNLYEDTVGAMMEFQQLYQMSFNATNSASVQSLFRPVLDVISRWDQVCPTVQSGVDLSLFYVTTGRFLSRSQSAVACCITQDTVGSWERHQLDIGEVNRTLQYGDVVGIRHNDYFVSNDNANLRLLSWWRWWKAGWEKFQLSKSCARQADKISRPIRICDTILLRSLKDDRYLTRRLTSYPKLSSSATDSDWIIRNHYGDGPW